MHMDESFFRSETPTTHTWGDRKDRKTIKVSGHQSTVGVIGAVDPEKGDHEEWLFESINSDVVNSFLWKLSERFPDEQILLIGDNASYHKNQGSEKYPLPLNIQLLFQPPYSPELNPQENVWKIIKDEFKNLLCRTAEELWETVDMVIALFRDHRFVRKI